GLEEHRGPVLVEAELAPLDPVPGVVGVLVVGAEDHREGHRGVEPELHAGGVEGIEGRAREDAPEVEHHGIDHPGSSPVSSRCSNPASSRIGTPSSSALVSLAAPGDSPTTTAVVFLDTEPGLLPPRDVMAVSASSRE